MRGSWDRFKDLVMAAPFLKLGSLSTFLSSAQRQKVPPTAPCGEELVERRLPEGALHRDAP